MTTRRHLAIGAAGFLAVGGAPFAFYPPARQVFDSSMVRYCEAALTDRLIAPATYRRISVGEEHVYKVSLEDYFSAHNTSGYDRQQIGGLYDHATRRMVFLTYEASNRYGVPLRKTVQCTDDSLYGDAQPASKYGVELDNEAVARWYVDMIAKPLHSN